MLTKRLINMDLLFVIEKLLPNKGTISLFRSHYRYLPISTLSLEHCDNASELQFAIFQYCPRYAEYSIKKNFLNTFIDQDHSDEDLAKKILINFIDGAQDWINFYLNIYNDNWDEKQKSFWLRDFKLLSQTIIGIGNCKKSAWFIKHHSIMETLTYNEQLAPFLPQYNYTNLHQ